MSRRSFLSMRAGGSAESALPLRNYFLSAGGALLLLLLAVDWGLPAPLPTRFANSDPALPPIRIHSDVRGPEAVLIDTKQPMPALAAENVMTASKSGGLEAPDTAPGTGSAAQTDDGEGRSIGSLTPQVRNSLAQSGAARAARTTRGSATEKSRHKLSHRRSANRPRFVGHSRPNGEPAWCGAGDGGCRSALMTSPLS